MPLLPLDYIGHMLTKFYKNYSIYNIAVEENQWVLISYVFFLIALNQNICCVIRLQLSFVISFQTFEYLKVYLLVELWGKEDRIKRHNIFYTTSPGFPLHDYIPHCQLYVITLMIFSLRLYNWVTWPKQSKW